MSKSTFSDFAAHKEQGYQGYICVDSKLQDQSASITTTAFVPKHFAIKVNLLLYRILNEQGPVVQSVVNLTSSLRVISLTVLADSIYNILIFFAEKM